MKRLIISENERNNILNKYYTKLSLNEVDYAGDTGQGTTTTVAPSQQQAPAKDYTIQELQQLLGFKGDAVDGKAGPNTLAAIEKALQSKGASAPATTTTTNAAQPTDEKPKNLSATPVQTKTVTGIDTKTGTVKTKDSNTQQQSTANQSETGDDPNS